MLMLKAERIKNLREYLKTGTLVIPQGFELVPILEPVGGTPEERHLALIRKLMSSKPVLMLVEISPSESVAVEQIINN